MSAGQVAGPAAAAAGPDAGTAAIDWARPWLSPYRASGQPREAAWRGGQTVAQALNPHGDVVEGAAEADGPGGPEGRGVPRFVPAGLLPAGEAYEAFIHRSGCVPTRDNLHDFFNGLVWRRFPRAKRRLNELQAADIAAHGVGRHRGALRDALTLFDENAALLQAPGSLARALGRRDWRALFATHRALWAEATLTLFGHALMEKLALRPRKAVTAHVWLLPPRGTIGGGLESQLLPTLEPARLAAKPFLPLPVLGVPGWWPDNETPGFYDDAAVFRPISTDRGAGPNSPGRARGRH